MKTVAFWIVTVLACLPMLGSGAGDLMQAPPILENVTTGLGYPAYFLYILGFWKLAGVIVVLLPGLQRAKEWAYAGFFFAMSGAAASHVFSSDVPGAMVPAVIAVLFVISAALRPEGRRLAPSDT